MIHKELNTGRARLALFTARDVADQHPEEPQNAITWPNFYPNSNFDIARAWTEGSSVLFVI